MCASSPYGLTAFNGCLRSNPDVVSVINWFDGWLAYQVDLARQIRGFSFVGVPLFHTDYSWAEAPYYAGMLAHCDAVVAMTEHERTFIERRSSRRNAHAVGVGVDPGMFADADGGSIRKRYSIGDAPLVGYVGRMEISKGVGTLVEAMVKVWRTDSSARLLLAGGGLPTSSSRPDEVSQAIHALSDAERSRIIRIDTFPDAIKASIFDALDIFAMPSVADSFGIAYLEAWMRKKPVIGSRTGSTQCVIDNGRDGVLVEPRNADDLAGAILRLLRDRAAREDMGKRGYQKTTTHFTWDRITDKIEHIYRQSHVPSPGYGGAPDPV
jgi:glycosyltransferase involved in cell wall biosynthesis